MPAREIIPLPPELRLFLAGQEFALLTADTTDGTALVAKLPREDIESCRGPIKILVRYELLHTQHGPVLRLLLVLHGRPVRITLETFGNMADPQQLAEWTDLLGRPKLRVLFYDELIRHQLSKLVSHPQDETSRTLIPEALRLLAATDPERLDFEQAKAIVLAETTA